MYVPIYTVHSKHICTLVYLQCFESFKFAHLAPLYLFPFRLALGSSRVFRPIADLLYLVPHSSRLARELDCFAKRTLIKLKQDRFTRLYFIAYMINAYFGDWVNTLSWHTLFRGTTLQIRLGIRLSSSGSFKYSNMKGLRRKKEKMKIKGAWGSIVGWSTMLQAGRSRVWFPMRSLYFSIDPILPATL
jgi:hypothetical protein